MGGNNLRNDDKKSGEGKFNFINEQVVNSRKINVCKFLLFLVSCGVIIGIAACVAFVWVKPYFAKFMMNGKQNDSKEVIQQSDTTMQLTTGTENNGETTVSPQNCLENMEKSVVTLSVNEEADWTRMEADNSNYSSGLIIYKGNNLKILTTYDFLKDNREVTVYLGTEQCKGNVESKNEEYGLAIINVNAGKLGDSVKDELAAVFSADEEYEAGAEITFMGNPYGKEKFIASGSLTSVGNAYNIVDTELEIMTTDISNTGLMNGFAFDRYGNVIGMVNDELNDISIGENVISIISFKEIAVYVEKMIKKQDITYLGIYGKQVTDEVIENIDKDMPYGIYISYTEEKSPAYVAGVMNGDILTEINGKKVQDFETFTSVLQKCQVNEDVVIKVMRKGKDGYKEIKYTVQIGGR